MFAATERTYFGLPGLASDTLTVRDKLRQRVNLYAMKEERTIEPETFAHLVSSTLYERRSVSFSRPVVLTHHCTAADDRARADSDRITSSRSSLVRISLPPLSVLIHAGLNSAGAPFIAAMDLIGCLNFAKVRPVPPRSRAEI